MIVILKFAVTVCGGWVVYDGLTRLSFAQIPVDRRKSVHAESLSDGRAVFSSCTVAFPVKTLFFAVESLDDFKLLCCCNWGCSCAAASSAAAGGIYNAPKCSMPQFLEDLSFAAYVREDLAPCDGFICHSR